MLMKIFNNGIKFSFMLIMYQIPHPSTPPTLLSLPFKASMLDMTTLTTACPRTNMITCLLARDTIESQSRVVLVTSTLERLNIDVCGLKMVQLRAD